VKDNKLYEMLRDLQNDNELGGFNEFPQFCEDFLFDAVEKGYLTTKGKKELKHEIENNFMSEENTAKYCDN